MNNPKKDLRSQFHLQLHLKEKKSLRINLTKNVKALYT